MQSIKGFNIREAEEKDLISCLILFKEFFKESKIDLKWSQDRMVNVFKSFFNNSNMVFFVSEFEDEIVGFIAGTTTQPLFSEDIVSTELAWFVTQEHRGSTTALRLFKTFEEWSKKNKAVLISISDIEDVNNLSTFYNKKGYKKTETVYTKRI